MRIKKGFTLIQLLISLIILSVILMATAPMITRSHKKISNRAPHGKYFCYYNEAGKLIEEYFNSKTRVSTREVEECKFKSPSKVASYQVELIGAGSGGSYYKDIQDDLQNTKTGQSTIVNGYSYTGDPMLEPDDALLEDAFIGEKITECAPTGKGADGQGLEYHAYYILKAQCGLYDSSVQSFVNGTSSEFLDFIKSKYDSDTLSTPKNQDTLSDECQSFVPEDSVEQWTVRIDPKTEIARGMKGSPNRYLMYSYTIDIPSKANIKNFLSTVGQNITAGKSKNRKSFTPEKIVEPAKSNSSVHTTGTGSSGLSVQEINFKNNYDTIKGANGKGQEYYAAIRKENGKYIFAKERALGGEGAIIEINSQSKIEINKGLEDAPDVPDTVATCTVHYPALDAISESNARTYKYGLAGLPANYSKDSYAQLSENCKITIGKGGLAGTEGEIADNLGKAGGETSLVCEDLNISQSSTGGAALSSYIETSTLDMDNWAYNHNLGWGQYPSYSYTTEVSVGAKPEGYTNKTNIFTAYKNLPTIEFGKGGNGNAITDNKLELWGYKKYTVGTRTVDYEGHDQSYTDAEIQSSATIIPAKNGETGAIIITW